MQQQPPQQPWGSRPQQPPQPPQRPWGYQPPKPPTSSKPQGPGGKPPWYRHPVGMLLIGAVVVIVLALIVPAFTAGGEDPRPGPTTGAAGAPAPPPTPGPAATTSTTLPATPADRLGQAIKGELGEVGTVTGVTAPPGRQVTVTWEVKAGGSDGLTRNHARFGVMRIMRVIQQAGADLDQGVRLVGRFQLPGGTAPTTVVRVRFAKSTIARADFDDRRYLEAFELADVAVIHPAFR